MMASESIEVFSPVDHRLLQRYTITTEAEIEQYMKQARDAATLWGECSVKQRLALLKPLKALLLKDSDEICDALVQLTGKVKTDILINEIYPLLEMLDYYPHNAAAILKPQPVITSPLAYPAADAYYEYRPYGVVAVLSPWNFPLQLTLYPLLTALIAGNAVIFKPSELSLPVADLILDLFSKLELPEHLVLAVIGAAETGQQLIAARPDLVFFTGGLNAGRSIMTAAAQHPVPVILELGGKDAMLVFADAHIERTVNAAVYGAFCSSGQVCVSVECLHVEKSLHNEFIDRLCAEVGKLKVGHGEDGYFGAITSKAQLEIIRAHYDDAIAKGAKASAEFYCDGNYMQPVVLWNLSGDMRIMQEETFGPLLAVMPFDDEESLIERLNASDFGLNASVWSQDIARAERIARRLQVGNWAVNEVIKNIGHVRLPFGGVKNSGFGRYRGVDGLRSFTCTVSGLVSRSPFIKEPNWFPYSQPRYLQLRAFLDFLFADDFLLKRCQRNWHSLLAFRQYARLNLRQHWRNLSIWFIKGWR